MLTLVELLEHGRHKQPHLGDELFRGGRHAIQHCSLFGHFYLGRSVRCCASELDCE